MRGVGWRVLASTAVVGCVSLAGPAAASATRIHGAAARERALQKVIRNSGQVPTNTHTPDDADLAGAAAQYGFERTAPGFTVSGEATLSAYKAARNLSLSGGAWQQVTDQPLNGEPPNYTDPFWSNIGAGFSIVAGRTTALAQTPNGTWYAGTADGGVWRSTNHGQSWTPISDSQPTLSIGALTVNPSDGSLWVGTGEANSNQDSYAGTGVYELTGGTFTRIGDDASGNNPLVSRTVFQITFDRRGTRYAATNNGLFRYSVKSGSWTEVLAPAGPIDNPPYDNQATTVQVVPGSNGRDVITAIGWRGPTDLNTQNNGFYASTNSGKTFHKVDLTGDIDASDIGRTTFAYSRDGQRLYAIVESPQALTANAESVLQGIFVSSGSPASVTGRWKKIGDETKLAASGSALAVGSGYGVGVQAWYNQDLAVSPTNHNKVYAGLEEVFQSSNGGNTWVTASPYWNYGLACGEHCPNTTHPDQHAMMISDGKIVIGNDGGVYSRPLSDDQQYGGWSDLNATLHSLQYYDGRAGSLSAGRIAVYGGLQDNGTTVLNSGVAQNAEAAGGDGFDVIVDPNHAERMVGEYTDGTMYTSIDGGHSYGYFISPGCIAQQTLGLTPRADCDGASGS